ncbi:MAG TPA: PAS domain S-box protein [Gammaproteobacteria bacterium]|nr:PAS domain S-box protein [Gammaproteobacteria bacterium]
MSLSSRALASATSLLLLPGVFLLDLQLPMGVAAGILYVIPILLTLWAPASLTWLVAVLSGLLVLAAIPLSPVAEGWIALVNRALSLLVILLTALLVEWRRRAEAEAAQYARSEEVFRESERILRQVIDLVPHRIFVKDAEGRFLLVNQAAAAAYGSSVEAMTGRLHQELHPDPEQVARMLADDRAVIESGQVRFMPEESFTGADGVRRTLRTTKMPFRLPGGAQDAVLGLAIDITEEKEREQQLEASEKKYRALLDNAVDAMLLADFEGNLVDANRKAEQLLGYSRAELQGMHASQLHPEEELPRLRQVFEQLTESGTTLMTHSVIRKDGSRITCEVAATAIHYGDQAVAQGIFRDITARERRMGDRLAQEQAHRDTLVREVHHRIKNNLQGVVGLLREQASAHPELEEAISAAIGQVQSIALVHGLHGQGDDLQVRLCDMVQAIARTASTLTRASVQPLLELDMPQPVQVRTEEAVPLALVLHELIQNAVKHGAGAGSPVTVRLYQTDQAAEVEVAGPGRLAGDFDFATGQGLGTGLGLVRSLLPHQGALLTFEQAGDTVRARLRLETPVILPEDRDLQSGA